MGAAGALSPVLAAILHNAWSGYLGARSGDLRENYGMCSEYRRCRLCEESKCRHCLNLPVVTAPANACTALIIQICDIKYVFGRLAVVASGYCAYG
jgi:hypothetical protein